MIRVAILGCGDFASRHAAIISALPERARLVAFSDRNEWKARAFAGRYTNDRAAVFTSHADMLARCGIDALVVCLPPGGHSDEVEQAAARGVHVFIEKPIALHPEPAWRMVEAAERARIRTQVGFMLRFGEAVEQCRRLKSDGRAGGTALFTGRYFCNALHAPWWRMRERSGGQLLEQAIHVLDLARHVGGEPRSVFCRMDNLFHHSVPDYTVEDVSATLITFKNGGLGLIAATNNAIPGQWTHDYRFVAERLTVDFRGPNSATFTPTSGDAAPWQVESSRDYRQAQMLDFLDAIERGAETRTPIREGALTLELALAAVRSAREQREVTL
jgi:predicted dehydrogenase